jgi:serine O-acetyltransferase
MLFNYKFLRPFAYLLVRLNDFFHGIWIGPKVKAGPGLFLAHSRGLIVNPDTVIGENCTIMQRVTLGGPNIKIGDNVLIGANAQIISRRHKGNGLTVGNNVKIAAGSVVIYDIPDNKTVAGNPAIIISSE